MELGVIFGGYRFERSTGRLWCGKREVRLTPKAAAVLGALVTSAGDLGPKRAAASVWSDTAVSDDALTSCVRSCAALGDNSKQRASSKRDIVAGTLIARCRHPRNPTPHGTRYSGHGPQLGRRDECPGAFASS
jgi:hypothetical protein